MRFCLVWALIGVSLTGAPAPWDAVAVYHAPGGAFTVGYPAGWTVVTSERGRVVAFVGPAVASGSTKFRPNFVVSILAARRGTTDAQAVQAADDVVARTQVGPMRLAQESGVAQDGKPVAVTYYVTGATPMRFYLVVGVAPRGPLLYVFIGTTSPEVSAYRAHATLYRKAILAFQSFGK